MLLPSEFLQMMTEQLGTEETEKLVSAITGTEQPTSIRTNLTKECKDISKSALEKEYNQIEWCNEGRQLKERPSFTSDPLFHAGAYYVQESSSMFLQHILKEYIDKTVIALDLCAAPGGKSTLTLSCLPKGSILFANEAIRQRCNILTENIIKWGNPNVIVTNNYAEDYAPLGQIFDVIICDAPCSGEGMFRKDEGAINDWSLKNVEQCWQRQKDIISNIWNSLKPGGILIYSTCTYNHYEDEDIINWIISEYGAEKLPLCDKKEWNISNGHFFPHKTAGEGFYICPVRKKEESDSGTATGNIKKKTKAGNITEIKRNTPLYKELQNYIKNPDSYTIYQDGESYYAFPKEHIDLLLKAKSNLRMFHSGIKLASTKGKNIQPDHCLAMSTEIDNNAFHRYELSREQAIAYLRTEAISIDAPKGYILFTYKGLNIGLGKNIGNRVNNLYPSEWRIRKNY